MFPAIEPFSSGMLGVGDSQQIYWECSGNPNGRAVVYLHGGPGSACTPQARRYFDPAIYRIVLIDQRGCGRSRPHVDDISDLEVNTTAHLVEDLECLRPQMTLLSRRKRMCLTEKSLTGPPTSTIRRQRVPRNALTDLSQGRE